ncbi:hypothetical protein J3E68DRAFT_401215 [Trichoderma sp. SZMC 28012]
MMAHITLSVSGRKDGIELVPLLLLLLLLHLLLRLACGWCLPFSPQAPTFSSGTVPTSELVKETGPSTAHVTHSLLRLFSGAQGCTCTHGEGHMGFGL